MMSKIVYSFVVSITCNSATDVHNDRPSYVPSGGRPIHESPSKTLLSYISYSDTANRFSPWSRAMMSR